MTTAAASAVHSPTPGLDLGTLDLMLEALGDFVAQELPDSRILELDHDDTCPEDTVRAMCSDALGVQLVFIPEEYGGLGGNAFDSYRICERMARVDIGLGTSVFATFLGSDPILMGGTEEQRKEWLGRIAEQGVICAYGATEPEAGSDLGCDERPWPSRSSGSTRPGDRATASRAGSSGSATAASPTCTRCSPWRRADRRGSSWSAAPRGCRRRRRRTSTASGCPTPRRSSSTTSWCPPTGSSGGVEGHGLVQAQQVFGYTRLMVAAFGLGGGWEAMDRAIRYSTERVQAGAPLSREAGLHAQAGRPARRPAGGGPRRRGGDRDPDRRR